MKVRLRSPGGNFLDPPAEGSSEHDFGSFFVEASRQVHPYSGDTLVTFEVITLPQSQWLGNWTLAAEEDSPGSATVGAVHAWIRDGAEGRFTTGATFEYLIGMPATAYSAVTVASYATRNQWKSRDPQNPSIDLEDLALEALSSFSSPGPTRDGDNKPDVAAPGEWLSRSALERRARLGASALHPGFGNRVRVATGDEHVCALRHRLARASPSEGREHRLERGQAPAHQIDPPGPPFRRLLERALGLWQTGRGETSDD